MHFFKATQNMAKWLDTHCTSVSFDPGSENLTLVPYSIQGTSTSPAGLAYRLVFLALPVACSACTTAREMDMQSLLHPD